MDVRELLRMLNRRKWHIVGIAAFVSVMTAIVLAQLVPEYRATALVMLDTRKAKVTNTADVLGGPTYDIAAVQTEIEVLRSSSLLGRVSDKLKLDEDSEFGAAPESALRKVLVEIKGSYQSIAGGPAEKASPARTDGPRLRAIATLTRNLSTVSRNRSYVIAVSMDSVDPAKAKRIIDTVTDFYIVDQLQAKLDANKRAVEFFDERLEELKRTVAAAESAAASFREKSGLTIGKDATIASQSLSELNSQLVQARAQRADRESRLIALQQAARNPQTLGGVTEVLANPLISSLRAQEAEVARRIGDLAQRYGDSHPRLLQAKAEQGQIQGRIGAEVSKILGSLQGDAEAAKSKEAELQSQVDQLEKKAGGLGQNEVQLRQLERERNRPARFTKTFSSGSRNCANSRISSNLMLAFSRPASVPTEAIYPRYALTMLVALVFGSGLAVVFVVILERLDGGFRTGDQIENLTGRAMLGMIPSLSRNTLGNLTPAEFAIERPSSAYGEALRSTYTAIMLGTLDKPPKVIMITSSVPGEGKSTFVCSLAGLIARSSPDKKVLVVDCDLRRSSVLKALGAKPTGGTVDEYLSGTKSLEQIIGREETSGLFYIPARPNTPNSAEILDSNAMRTFIQTLSEAFDLVGARHAAVDGRFRLPHYAKVADYIVFLVRWEQTAREVAVNSLRLLREARKDVGIVLSQVDVRRHSRYGYGDYGYYYAKYRDYYTS